MSKARCLLIIMSTLLLLTGCGSSLYEDTKSGYSQATSVRGVKFDMPSNFLEQATAITNISEEVDYSSGTYLYKNGKDTYLLFNMDGVVVAVQQGTTYNLRDAEDVKKRITETDVCEVWVTDDKKIDIQEQNKDGEYKLIANTYADVSITSTLYTTCYGYFAIVQYADYECSMFVGVPCEDKSELTGKQNDTIEHIAKSLVLDTDYIEYMSGESVNTEADTTTNTQTETEADEEKDTEMEAVELESEETESVESAVTTEGTEVVTEQNEELEATETPEAEPETELETEVTEETQITETEVKEDEKDNKEYNASSLGSNQSESKNGYSDIYHMLSIGQMGILNACANDGLTLEKTQITITVLYTGDDAINIIKEYCNSKDALYEYQNPPAGYSWHVVEYKVLEKPEDLYVNIKMLGLDGEKLKFRGIAASSRTFDIFSFMETGENCYEKLYCYYAVPNGCKEYMLECGTRTPEDSLTACYKVSDWR